MQINSSCETFYSAIESPIVLPDSFSGRENLAAILRQESSPNLPRTIHEQSRKSDYVFLSSPTDPKQKSSYNASISPFSSKMHTSFDTSTDAILGNRATNQAFPFPNFDNDEIMLKNGTSLRLIKSNTSRSSGSKSIENFGCFDMAVGIPGFGDFPHQDYHFENVLNSGDTHTSDKQLLSAPITLESPRASVSFSPADNTMYNRSYKRQRVIEELIESEETYITSLNMLLSIYIEPIVDLNPYHCGVPVALIEKYIRLLISHHDDLLFRLRKVMKEHTLKSMCSPSVSIVSEDNVVSDIHLPSPYVAAVIATLVSKRGISTLLYEEYCNVYEDVLLLMKSTKVESVGTLNESWTKGCESFLETTQPNGRHQDLSFLSLVQRPVSRIAKYRLILESLLKYTTAADDAVCFQSITSNLNSIRKNLSQINDNYKESKMKDKTKQIYGLLNFTYCQLSFPSEFFGRIVLSGSVVGIWNEYQVTHFLLGAFLFKSHLVLADCSKNSRFDPKFVIPLACCKILEVGSGDSSGLYALYPYTLKLIFEKDYGIFEILLSFLSLEEFNIWKDELVLLINFVNGPYKFDYSASKPTRYQKLSVFVPTYIAPMEVCVDKCSNKYVTQCYFSRVITVRILHFQSSKILDQSYLDQEKFGSYESTVEIKKTERAWCEINMKDVYSEELPLYCVKRDTRNNATLKKKSSLKKTGSWSSLRVGSLRSFKGSYLDESGDESSQRSEFGEKVENANDKINLDIKKEQLTSKEQTETKEKDINQIEIISQGTGSSSCELKRNTGTSGSMFRKLMVGLFENNTKSY